MYITFQTISQDTLKHIEIKLGCHPGGHKRFETLATHVSIACWFPCALFGNTISKRNVERMCCGFSGQAIPHVVPTSSLHYKPWWRQNVCVPAPASSCNPSRTWGGASASFSNPSRTSSSGVGPALQNDPWPCLSHADDHENWSEDVLSNRTCSSTFCNYRILGFCFTDV